MKIKQFCLVLLGAPGAGKGTQAEIISKKYNIPTISTGNLIREEVSKGTKLGLKTKTFIDEGKLVPDSLAISIIKERLLKSDCSSGFILDGMPRNISQAKALDEMGVIINQVISIEVPDEKIMLRLSGRRVCNHCGASYHVTYKPPIKANICDNCNNELIIRQDDRTEIILNRLKIYHDQTKLLKQYYNFKGILTIVEGQDKVSDTTKLVDEVLILK